MIVLKISSAIEEHRIVSRKQHVLRSIRIGLKIKFLHNQNMHQINIKTEKQQQQIVAHTKHLIFEVDLMARRLIVLFCLYINKINSLHVRSVERTQIVLAVKRVTEAKFHSLRVINMFCGSRRAYTFSCELFIEMSFDCNEIGFSVSCLHFRRFK